MNGSNALTEALAQEASATGAIAGSIASHRSADAGQNRRAAASTNKTRRSDQAKPNRGKRLSRSDLLLITTQLSIMTRASMDLADAIFQIARHTKDRKVKHVLETIHDDLQEGKSFSSALNAQVNVFGETYVACIAAGEASGKMVDVLGRLKELLRNEVRLRSAIRGALIYPAVLLIVAMCVLVALMFFVLPQFDKVFQSLNAPVPPLTQLLLDLGRGLRTHLWGVLLGLGAAGYGVKKLWPTPPMRRLRDRALLDMRWVRSGSRPLITGRVLRLIGTMLQSGVALLDAIRLCRWSVKCLPFDRLFAQMEEEILAGRGISHVLAAAKCVPVGTAEMIATAEMSGSLGSVMEMVGEFYEEEGERRIRDLVKLLEPAIIVLMGGLVAVVVASVMLPLFDLSSSSSH